MFSKFWHCWILLYLFAGFRAIILCSVHPKWFVKFVFSAKVWFVKTSTRIVKYESLVVKSNPEDIKVWCLLSSGILHVTYSLFSHQNDPLIKEWLPSPSFWACMNGEFIYYYSLTDIWSMRNMKTRYLMICHDCRSPSLRN